MIICPRAFIGGPSVFPQTPEDRAIAYYNLQFPQNHSNHYAKWSLVGTVLHEMHHALFIGSKSMISDPQPPRRYHAGD